MAQDDQSNTDNPYVGPRTFQRGESHLFFGRGREARDLQSLVISRRLVLFYAQSGAGKSSLINTRLIPGLEKKNFEVLPVARIGAEMQPDADVSNIYVNNLLLSIDPALTHRDVADTTLSHFLDHLILAEGRYFYDENYLYPEDYEIKPRVLIIDQFEELFTAYPEAWREQAGFFRQLDRAMEVDEELWVVLVMREDYIAKLDPYTHLLTGGLHHRYYMQPMAESAALKAIKEPARRAGRPFEESAAMRLVNDLRRVRSQSIDQGTSFVEGQFIEPVQLQVVCFQLWEELKYDDGREIDNDHLNRMAGDGDLAHFVNNALAQFYEDSVADVLDSAATMVCEPELRDWFSQKLITEAKTRGIVYQGEEKSGGLENEATRILENHYLIRAVTRAGGRWLELVHDRFIDPILEANENWLQSNPLVMASRNWEKSGRKGEHLFLGKQLADALGTPNRGKLGPLVREFLEKSQEAERAHQEERERRERQLEEQRQRAEERAQEQAAFAATLRRRQYVLIAVLVVAIALAIVAISFAGLASRNEQLAATNQAKAEANEVLAATRAAEAVANANLAATRETEALANEQLAAMRAAEAVANADLATTREAEANQARQDAEEEKLRADEAGKLVFARQLAAQARELLDQNPQLAVLLALESRAGLNTDIDDVVEFSNRQVDPILASAPYVYPPLEATLNGHPARILALAWSPDGKQLASGSADQSIVIWDVARRQPLARLIGHGDWVRDLDWSPDGSQLASGSYDGTVRIWDVANLATDGGTMNESRLVGEYDAAVRAVSWSPTGDRLASGSDDRSIVIWDMSGGETITTTLTGHASWIRALTWSPDGRQLASASEDETVRIWDVESAETIRTLDLHADGVLDVAWSPDGRQLASAGRDNAVILWDVQNNWAPTHLQEHTDIVWSLSWSPDSSQLASGSVDKEVIVWDTVAGQAVSRFRGHSDDVLALAWSPAENGPLASAGRDNSIVLWDMAANFPAPAYGDPDGRGILSVSWNPDSRRLAFGTDNSRELASGNKGGSVLIWDTATDDSLILDGHDEDVNSVAWNPDGDLVATGSGDGSVIIWDVSNGIPVSRLEADAGPVWSVAWSPDGQELASAFHDGTVIIWDVATGQPVISLNGHDGIVWTVTWSPDGAQLATGSEDRTIILWDRASGQELARAGHDGAVWSLAWSPDGAMLASGSEDQTVRLWDVASLSAAAEAGPAMTLTGHRAGVRRLAWEPGGLRLASASGDGTIRIWDATDGRQLAQLLGTYGTPYQADQAGPTRALDVSWSPDGDWLVSALSAGSTGLVRLINNRFVSEPCQLVSRNLLYSGEWQEYLPADRMYEPTCPNHPILPSVLVDAAQGQALAGDIDGAVQLYEQALDLEPGIILLDPALEVALIRVAGGDPDLEDMKQAIAAYESDGLDPVRASSPGFLNALCWEGSLAGFAGQVLRACEVAVNLEPNAYVIRDSRALARALTGNYQGAIIDFETVLGAMENSGESPDVIAKRLAWLADLEAGVNPFDAATLAYLRQSE